MTEIIKPFPILIVDPALALMLSSAQDDSLARLEIETRRLMEGPAFEAASRLTQATLRGALATIAGEMKRRETLVDRDRPQPVVGLPLALPGELKPDFS